MKPEVRAILEKIGYNQAKRKTASLFFGSGFNETGGLAFSNKATAREALKKIEDVEKALAELPESVLEIWGNNSRSTVDWDTNRCPLSDVIDGLLEIKSQAETAIVDPFENKYGRNHAADEIAYKMAEIYVLGMGRVPDGMARKGDDGKPSGDYTKAVQAMLDELGIKNVGARKPCERAVRKLIESGRAEALLKADTANFPLFQPTIRNVDNKEH
ncbi:hypothetical protein [uncultured Ruegeria sp.]|uniref:hypothetical protein n=1 Tax=uncultured Ruegeria sp. TaxID=259304 RepID=UPI00260E5069|nr:hypothetical protein [uncultured Ruegeria sp.]